MKESTIASHTLNLSSQLEQHTAVASESIESERCGAEQERACMQRPQERGGWRRLEMQLGAAFAAPQPPTMRTAHLEAQERPPAAAALRNIATHRAAPTVVTRQGMRLVDPAFVEAIDAPHDASGASGAGRRAAPTERRMTTTVAAPTVLIVAIAIAARAITTAACAAA